MPSIELLSAYARLETRGRADMERALGSVKKTAIDMQGALEKAASAAKKVLLIGAGVTGLALKLASDAEQAASKFDIVFGRQSKVVEKWAKTFEKQTGRASSSLKPFLANIGAMLKPLGASSEQVGELSERITQFGFDLASFHDTADAEAMQALVSGLFAGEAEPLKRYAVLLTAVKVDTELLALGFKKASKGATDFQKFQARLNIALRESQIVHGNLADTRHEAANQVKALTSQYHAMMVELGNALLPTLVEIIPELVKLAEAISKFIVENKEAVVTTVKWGTAFGAIVIVLPKITKGVAALTRGIKSLAAAQALAGATGMFGAGAAGAGAAGAGAANAGRRFLPRALAGAGAGAASAPSITTSLGSRAIGGATLARAGGVLAAKGAIAGGIGLLAIPMIGVLMALDKNTQAINKAARDRKQAAKDEAAARREEIIARHKASQEKAFGIINERVVRALSHLPEYERPVNEPIKDVALVEREMRALERANVDVVNRIHELEQSGKDPVALKFYQERLDRIREALQEIYKPLDEYKNIQREQAERQDREAGKRTGSFKEALERGAAGDRMNWVADQNEDAKKTVIPKASLDFFKTSAAGLQEMLQRRSTQKEQTEIQNKQLDALGNIDEGVQMVAEGIAKIQLPGGFKP